MLIFVYLDKTDLENISILPPVCTPAQKQLKPRRKRQGKSAEPTSDKYRTNLLQKVTLKDVSNISKILKLRK